MIIGRWSPLGAFGAALLFASSAAIGQSIGISPPPGELGAFVADVPGQFFDALPYIVTIVVLAGVIGKSIPPAADGQPYERESATETRRSRPRAATRSTCRRRRPVPILDDGGIADLLRRAADRGDRRLAATETGPPTSVFRYLVAAGLRRRAGPPAGTGGRGPDVLPDPGRCRCCHRPGGHRRRLPARRRVPGARPRGGGRGRSLPLAPAWDREAEAARIAVAARLSVVMDRCIMVDHRKGRRLATTGPRCWSEQKIDLRPADVPDRRSRGSAGAMDQEASQNEAETGGHDDGAVARLLAGEGHRDRGTGAPGIAQAAAPRLVAGDVVRLGLEGLIALPRDARPRVAEGHAGHAQPDQDR